MGKAKKLKLTKAVRNEALDQQISRDSYAQSKGRVKTRDRQEGDDSFVDDKLSAQILKHAREQQKDLEGELQGTSNEQKRVTISLGGATGLVRKDEESDSEPEAQSDDEGAFYEDIEVNEEDERALEMFMNPNPAPKRTLADIIAEKLTEKQTEIQSQFSEAGGFQVKDLDPSVVAMYEKVGIVLSRYRSGKLPKAFKILPSLQNWEQILYITNPDKWSAGAMYAATRIFTSNLTEKMAQRFFNLVLLPRVRDDIAEFKKLNFHLYQALRKALFKPGAFFKGFLLPLCESGDCTLREAIIVGSVLAKCSIPVLHSAAAMLKLAEMNYSGSNSIFLRILFDKKYALPFRVVDAVVHHFLRQDTYYRNMNGLIHVLFHSYLQRQKKFLSFEFKSYLFGLLRARNRPSLWQEIIRRRTKSECVE
nr:EOG090X058P [Eulimnadia texana]